MKQKKYQAGIPYNNWEIELLRSDPKLTVEYLKAALESLARPEERPGGLLMLRAVAEACGGLGAIAAQAGISRESLYRTLSPKGNPTLKTLIAILNTLGLRLSVVPAPAKKVTARKKPARKPRKAATAGKAAAKAAKKTERRAA